jgi:hypothetical protein
VENVISLENLDDLDRDSKIYLSGAFALLSAVLLTGEGEPSTNHNKYQACRLMSALLRTIVEMPFKGTGWEPFADPDQRIVTQTFLDGMEQQAL